MKMAYAIIDFLFSGIVITFVASETGSMTKAWVAVFLVGLYGLLNFYQGITRRGKSQ